MLNQSVGESLSGATDIKAVLLSASYTPNLSTDQFYSTVSSFALGTPVALTSVTTTLGKLTSANATYTMNASSSAKYLLLFRDTGVASTSPLIFLDDTSTTTTLPYTSGSTSQPITIQPDSTYGFCSL